MTTTRPPADDLDAEREIDLSRWRQVAAERWWIVLGGIVAGALVGAILAVGSGSVYRASVLLAPGQAFTPSGSPTLSYYTSPRAIEEIVNSEAVLKQAAAKAKVSVSNLRGKVNTEAIETGLGPAATRSAVLIRITVQLSKPRKAELAANELGAIVVERTTSTYVEKAIETYQGKLRNYDRQLASLTNRIQRLTSSLEQQGEALGFEGQLLLVLQLDNAEQRFGNLSDRQALAEQQLTLAQDVMLTKVIEDAVAVKTTARSPRNSILVGILLGFILGAVAALVVDWRAARARPV
jgi:hypothetical protein